MTPNHQSGALCFVVIVCLNHLNHLNVFPVSLFVYFAYFVSFSHRLHLILRVRARVAQSDAWSFWPRRSWRHTPKLGTSQSFTTGWIATRCYRHLQILKILQARKSTKSSNKCPSNQHLFGHLRALNLSFPRLFAQKFSGTDFSKYSKVTRWNPSVSTAVPLLLSSDVHSSSKQCQGL